MLLSAAPRTNPTIDDGASGLRAAVDELGASFDERP